MVSGSNVGTRRFLSSSWSRVGLLAILFVIALLLDRPVAESLARPIRSGQLQGALRALRCWGEGITIFLLSAGLACGTRRWKESVAMALVGLACGAVVDLAKPLTGRQRPQELLMGTATLQDNASAPLGIVWGTGQGRNSSFPSGHTAAAFGFARGLSLAHPSVAPIALLAAAGTGLSRMYEQRHFLSDCLVGAMIGWFLGGTLWYGLSRLDAVLGKKTRCQANDQQPLLHESNAGNLAPGGDRRAA